MCPEAAQGGHTAPTSPHVRLPPWGGTPRAHGPGNPYRKNCYPGCTAAHDEQHRTGIKTFQAKYGLDLPALAH